MSLELLLLCCTAFTAGFVDAIVGGGGLIQMPVMLLSFPNSPIASVLATNKVTSFTGTSIAAYQYSKHVKLQYRLLSAIVLCAFSAALVGSALASLLSNAILKPVILVVLTFVLIYTYSNKKFGIAQSKNISGNAVLYSLVFGLLIGFYDGFIGPGTGSFLILLFVSLLGQDFLHANAHAKLVNLSTNFASLLYFGIAGDIMYQYAIPMAICSAIGAFAGSRFAILRGNNFIRVFFLLVVSATLLRLAWDVFSN